MNDYFYNIFHHVFQAVDSDKRRPSSSRNGSTSRKALLSSSRGSGDPSAPNRSSHLVPTTSSSSRPSTNQRLHQSTGLEGRTSSFPKPGRNVHDDPTMRSFERLTISAERRKWNFGREGSELLLLASTPIHWIFLRFQMMLIYELVKWFCAMHYAEIWT